MTRIEHSRKRNARFRILGLTLAALFAVGVCIFSHLQPALAQVPRQINYQGVVAVNGVKFTGTGEFRFALVDPDTNLNAWANDAAVIGTSNTPQTVVAISVANGVYSTRLGDPALGGQPPLPPGAFADGNLVLRVWFSSTAGGPAVQLSPDQRLTSAPYALYAQSAATVPTNLSPPLGSIVAWHANIGGNPLPLPDGWQSCDGSALPQDSPLRTYGATDVPNLNSAVGYDGGFFLRGRTTSGMFQDPSRVFNGSDGSGQQYRTPHTTSWVYETDGQASYNVHTNNASPSCWCANTNPEPNNYRAVRPLNMSVVWIIRVK